jgi:hypothetical protein
MKNPKQKYTIPEYDPQTGEKNPYWVELTETIKGGSIDSIESASLDVLVDMLEGKYKLQSTVDSYAINQLIEFYKRNKKYE